MNVGLKPLYFSARKNKFKVRVSYFKIFTHFWVKMLKYMHVFINIIYLMLIITRGKQVPI
jgi:hypothetical protein